MPLDIMKAFMAYVESDGSVEFDMHAQDTDDWKFLQELIPGILVTSAGGIGLFQAEGLLDEHPFYFRSETGSSSICVATPDGSPHLFTGDVLWFGRCETDPNLFRMNSEEFVRELYKCMRNLEVAPFPYEFSGKKLVWNDNYDLSAGWTITEDLEKTFAYGHSAEEAYRKTQEPFDYGDKLPSYTAAVQLQHWRDQEFSPIPLRTDARNFPATTPEFLKLSERL